MALTLIRVLIGSALVMFGAFQLGETVWLVRYGVQTEGAVAMTVDYRLAYAPIIDFDTLDGHHIHTPSRLRPKMRGINDTNFRLDFTRLYYDPSTPSRAVLADPADLWIWPGALFLFGVMVSALGPLARRIWGD